MTHGLNCEFCGGVLDFVYHIYWQCRVCGRWCRRRL